MMKWMLAAGAAALAISSPTLAEKGGQGGGKDKAQAAKAEKGGGKDKAQSARGHGDHGKAMKVAQGGDHKQKGQGKVRSDNDRGKGAMKSEDRGRDRGRTVQAEDRGQRGRDLKVDNDRDVKVVKVDRDFDGVRFVPGWDNDGLRRGFVNGCPPGLDKKNNGCLPPGQAKKLVGTPLAAALRANTLGWPYNQWYRDDDNFMYRLDDDYIYRVRRDNSLIDALFPFANRDYYYYPMGAPYPDAFNFYNVPYQYQAFYPDGGDNWYRYGDGAIYMVDPQTRMIQGIAALLTGAPMGIGQPLPPAYGVYNVPFAYRSQYFDTADNWYRYNDGYIYRVDPTTQLITSIISLIT